MVWRPCVFEDHERRRMCMNGCSSDVSNQFIKLKVQKICFHVRLKTFRCLRVCFSSENLRLRVLPNRKNKINDRVALSDSCLWKKIFRDFTASVGEKNLVDLQPRARRQLPVQTCYFFCACEEVSWHFGSLLQWRKIVLESLRKFHLKVTKIVLKVES